MPKDKTPEKILRAHAAKIKEKKEASVRTLDVPEGQYTHEITCIECGAKRKIKPQDKHQVKRCVDCQNKKGKEALTKLIERKTNPAIRAGEILAKRIDKLEEWAMRTDKEVQDGFKRLREYQRNHDAAPKGRRVWP